MSIIRDKSLWQKGKQKIDWVRANMPLLTELEERFIREQPFAGLKITVSVHFEAKTANLCKVLAAGGAEVAATGSNPLSTKDDICAALDHDGINVYGWFGATNEEYWQHLNAALDFGPDLLVDDGGDLVELLHEKRADLLPKVMGGSEETTSGVARLKARSRAGLLKFPMFCANDANSKHLFDNRYGTGQSCWDGIMRATNLQISGRTAVIAGYGWCGRGLARVAEGLGAKVIVTEVDPFKAIEAHMDGFTVMPMEEAAEKGDFFVCATGNLNVIRKEHFLKMKNGAIMANAGHFDVEICIPDLKSIAVKEENRRDFIDGYTLKNGRTINLLSQGRLVNVTAGDGHPADIMDMSFAIQALTLEYIVKEGKDLKPGYYDVPKSIDELVSKMKLKSLGVNTDTLTDEQISYMQSW